MGISLVLSPCRAQLCEQLATTCVAKLLTQGCEVPGLRMLPEHQDLRLQRIDRRRWLCRETVFGHPRPRQYHGNSAGLGIVSTNLLGVVRSETRWRGDASAEVHRAHWA